MNSLALRDLKHTSIISGVLFFPDTGKMSAYTYKGTFCLRSGQASAIAMLYISPWSSLRSLLYKLMLKSEHNDDSE